MLANINIIKRKKINVKQLYKLLEFLFRHFPMVLYNVNRLKFSRSYNISYVSYLFRFVYIDSSTTTILRIEYQMIYSCADRGRARQRAQAGVIHCELGYIWEQKKNALVYDVPTYTRSEIIKSKIDNGMRSDLVSSCTYTLDIRKSR